MAIKEFVIHDYISIAEIISYASSTYRVSYPAPTELQSKTMEQLRLRERWITEKIPKIKQIDDQLVLTETILLNRPVIYMRLTDYLILNEKFATDKGIEYVSDHLTLTETIAIEVNNHVKDILTFTEKIKLTHLHKRLETLSDPLVLTDGLSYVLVHNHKPGIPFNFESLCSTFIQTQLHCSFLAGSDLLTLLAPNKGNSDDIDVGRINRRTRGGELIMFRAPNWPRKNVLNMDIPMYSCNDIKNIRFFFNKYLGKVIQFTDHESIVYNGIVTNLFEFTEENDVTFKMHVEFTQLF